MKLNEFENLRYQEAKRQPLHDIMDGYNKRNPMKQEKPSDSVEYLRERYLKDRNSLSAIELLTLGMSELQSKRDAVQEERQKAINDYMQPYHENKDKQEEYISTISEEFQQLAKQMAELQAEFQRLNGGDN
jgi:DNA repair exonuclease SbcCD ATPase subunit